VVQAALGKARGRDRKPYWPGPIDGDFPRHRKALGQSIAIFQQAHRLRPSGKINRLGSDVDRLESALPAGHRRMSGVPGTTLVRRRNTAAPAPAAEAAAKTEATAPLPDVERAALAALQRDLYEAHNLFFMVTGIGVVSGGRFQVSLACPDSEWLDLRRNVFELGGKLPPALRKGLEGTLQGAARAWKPVSGDSPGLVLASANTYPALRSGASPKGADLEALGITQTPGDPTVRAALAACIDLILSGEAATPAGRKQFDGLAECVAVINPQMRETLVAGIQLAGSHKDRDDDYSNLRNRNCLETVLEVDPVTKQEIMECRVLTSGEIALAMSVFGTNIPYESVHVFRRKHNPGQPYNRLMAPDGHIYADKDWPKYSEDYSSEDLRLQATFIHEMAHVWQVQTMGIDLVRRAPFEREYDYTLEPGKKYLEYKVEQQAAIAGDYFRFLTNQSPINGTPSKNGIPLKGKEALGVYAKLLPFVPFDIWT